METPPSKAVHAAWKDVVTMPVEKEPAIEKVLKGTVGWRGYDARRIKIELQTHLGRYER